MTDLGHETANLDARLAQIDRKLREIQADLQPDREPRPLLSDLEPEVGLGEIEAEPPPAAPEPPPAAPEPPPEPEHPPEPTPAPEPAAGRAPHPSLAPAPPYHGRSGPLEEVLRQQANAARPSVQERLVRQVEELTELHVGMISSIHRALDEVQRALRQLPRLDPTEVTLSAGPFTTIQAVRSFQQELMRLRGVREVTLRGYEGEDRAVLDVQLEDRST